MKKAKILTGEALDKFLENEKEFNKLDIAHKKLNEVIGIFNGTGAHCVNKDICITIIEEGDEFPLHISSYLTEALQVIENNRRKLEAENNLLLYGK